LRGMNVKETSPKLRHYAYRWVPRPRGSARLLEMPKSRLKALQRRILTEILDRIPAHDAAHGFRRGRSVVSYVRPHVAQTIVLRFDLADFFASVSAAKVRALFRTAGYPDAVAALLTGLCTTRTPNDVWSSQAPPPHWRSAHLPQGAPSS